MQLVHEETMCCGYRKCPRIRVFADGSIELSDDDPAIGSIGTVKLRPEVVDRVVELLSTLGSGKR
jgi:hypothetical protein